MTKLGFAARWAFLVLALGYLVAALVLGSIGIVDPPEVVALILGVVAVGLIVEWPAEGR